MASANQPDTRAELAELLKRKSELSVRGDRVMSASQIAVLWGGLVRFKWNKNRPDVIGRRDPYFCKYLEPVKKLPLPKL